MTDPLTVTRHDNGVVRVMIDDKSGRNKVNLAFCKQFESVAAEYTADPSVKVIVYEARGDYFCVGGDIGEFVRNEDHIHDYVMAMTKHYHAGIVHLTQADAMVVVALNGMAAGGGFSLVCAADLVFARRSARLNSGYTRSGLTPDAGATYTLPRIVGPRKAFELMALNTTLNADEAQGLGMVSRVFPDETFDADLDKALSGLTRMTPGVLAKLKRLVREGQNRSLAEHLDVEGLTIAGVASSPETMARLKAFGAD
jgi:2-(1,2-epoxy-1,2-dihydrophenyl)acetyl-CoA isomerase